MLITLERTLHLYPPVRAHLSYGDTESNSQPHTHWHCISSITGPQFEQRSVATYLALWTCCIPLTLHITCVRRNNYLRGTNLPDWESWSQLLTVSDPLFSSRDWQILLWLCYISLQAILMSLCLQSIVDEILRIKQGKPVKRVGYLCPVLCDMCWASCCLCQHVIFSLLPVFSFLCLAMSCDLVLVSCDMWLWHVTLTCVP